MSWGLAAQLGPNKKWSPLERRYIGREAATGSGLARAALVGCHLVRFPNCIVEVVY